MASSTLRQLLQPPNQTKAEESSLAFINSKFPSINELEDEELWRRVTEEARSNHDKLQAELGHSQAAIDQRLRQVVAATHQHLAQAQELSLSRHELADELSVLSSELVSSLSREPGAKPTMLEELESLHRNLKELESVKSYIAIIHRALKLSEASIAEAKTTLVTSDTHAFTPSCLSHYRTLQSFVLSVSELCENVENPSQDESQPLALISFLFKVRDQTWTDIRNAISSRFLETLDKMGWPQAIEYTTLPAQDRAQFESQFLDLIKLQDAGTEVHASDHRWKRGGVYPIQALTLPIVLRFKFHFERKRDTNRIDKPEWYFTHMANMVHLHRTFLESVVQSLLSRTSFKGINAFREFILPLLPPVIRKLRLAIPKLLQHPSLFAHTIYQALAFDASLKDEGFSLEGTTAEFDATEKWPGVSDEILRKKEWFEAWVEEERKFADNQYNEIISSPDAWQIANDTDDLDSSVAESDLRPTNSARRIKSLIEQITDRYQPLPRFTARTRFLIAVQLPILEAYHSRISSSLDAFETLSSSFVRAVPGALTGQVGHGTEARSLTSGTDGVSRLIKAGISAYYIALEMERWGEDLFFLELWSEINTRATLRAKAEAHPLLPQPATDDLIPEVAAKGTIFQELVAQYQTLGQRAEDMIVGHICAEIESAAKPYFTSRWDHPAPDETSLSIPTTLVAPISLLSTHLAFLLHSLPASLVVGLYRRVATNLATLILQKRILHRNIGRLSAKEGKQIVEESLVWIEACRMSVSAVVRKVETPWTRLLDTVRLLSLESEKFQATVDAIFNADQDHEEELRDNFEVSELNLTEMKTIVRLREDCWR